MPAKRRQVQQKPNPKHRVHSVGHQQSIPKAKIVSCLVFVVAIAWIILHRFSVIAELNYELGKLNKQYDNLREENRLLQVEIATSVDLDEISRLAEEKLNMHKPDRFQTVLVSVPKNNYSVVMNQEYIDKTTENASLLKRFIDSIKAVLP